MIHMDAADRILIPSSLTSYADLKKDVVLFAYHEQVEVWDKAAYDEMLAMEPGSFSQVANKVFGGGGVLDETTQSDES